MQTTTKHGSTYRVGLIVPSSNTTMETEIPALLRRQEQASGHRFTFHSARLRLRQVTPEALRAMNADAGEAVQALCDAQVDALMYACLVATMFDGRSSMLAAGQLLAESAAGAGMPTLPIVSSAGALIASLRLLGARRIALIAPYRKELTAKVAATIAVHGIAVAETRSLEVADNVAVGRLDPQKLLALARELDTTGCDAVVLSACVQMPSLDVLEEAEQRLGLPVISAAAASVRSLLDALAIEPAIENAGSLLRARPAAMQQPQRRAA
jgi:maleate isomerase